MGGRSFPANITGRVPISFLVSSSSVTEVGTILDIVTIFS